MKIVCSQSKLNNILNVVSRAVPARPSHPALAMLKFVADNNGVSITGFDLSLGITAKIDSEILEEGSTCLPASLLHDIISKMPSADICLHVNGEICTVSCGKGQYEILTMSSDEFPDLPSITDGFDIKLSSELFLEGVKNTLVATSTDETKMVLTGVNFSTKGELLKFAATDGHRLSVASFPLEESAEFDLTIPRKTLSEVQKVLLTNKYDEIEICFKDNQISFKLGDDFLIVSRILDGAYPKYETLIPPKFNGYLTTDRKDLLTAIERVSVLADAKNNLVKWDIDIENQYTKISVETPDVGRGDETLPTQNTGEPMAIAFNGKYLIDCLKTFTSQEIQASINTPSSPVVFKPLSNVNALYLIMPVQLRG